MYKQFEIKHLDDGATRGTKCVNSDTIKNAVIKYIHCYGLLWNLNELVIRVYELDKNEKRTNRSVDFKLVRDSKVIVTPETDDRMVAFEVRLDED